MLVSYFANIFYTIKWNNTCNDFYFVVSLWWLLFCSFCINSRYVFFFYFLFDILNISGVIFRLTLITWLCCVFNQSLTGSVFFFNFLCMITFSLPFCWLDFRNIFHSVISSLKVKVVLCHANKFFNWTKLTLWNLNSERKGEGVDNGMSIFSYNLIIT